MISIELPGISYNQLPNLPDAYLRKAIRANPSFPIDLLIYFYANRPNELPSLLNKLSTLSPETINLENPRVRAIFRNIFNTDSFCDFTVKVECPNRSQEKESVIKSYIFKIFRFIIDFRSDLPFTLKVNRSVISLSSSYFRENLETSHFICVTDTDSPFNSSNLLEIFRYWHGFPLSITPANIFDLLYASSFFGDPKLYSLCEDWYIQNISIQVQDIPRLQQLALYTHSSRLKALWTKKTTELNNSTLGPPRPSERSFEEFTLLTASDEEDSNYV